MLLVVHRENDDNDAVIAQLKDLATRIEAVQLRHRQIEKRDVREVRLGETDCLAAVAGLRNDLESLALEDEAESFANHFVIVREQKA
jgi:hypothetical protein